MSHERSTPENHWQALAAELGLETEPETASPIQPTPPREREPAPAADDAREEAAAPRPPVRAVTPGQEYSMSEDPSERMPEPEPEARPEPLDPNEDRSPAAAEPRGQERAPNRRRGRRRGRSDREGQTEPAEGAGSAAEGSEGESGDVGPRRRRRGRSRRPRGDREEATPAPADVADEPPAVEPPPAPAEETDEDIDDLSTWDVPSWNELIASLYRPDR